MAQAEKTTAKQLEGMLIELLSDDCGQEAIPSRSLRTFEDEGVLTRNAGFTIRLENGSEFQITIIPK